MKSEHFRIDVCGLEDGVMLGLYSLNARSVCRRGVGFVGDIDIKQPFCETRVFAGPDFEQRVRKTAEDMLRRAETRWNAPTIVEEMSDTYQRLAEEALKSGE